MRFYTNQHPFYCGIDLPARSMYVCIVNHAGEVLLHRNMKAAPESFLKAIAPYREGRVVAVECMCTWYWLADLCAHEGIAFVLGHALSMTALHGGKATHDQIDSHKIAVVLRGGMLPHAEGYPAPRRAPRDRLRRRPHLMRKRADLLAQVQQTNSQDNLPALGKKLAYNANRNGVAARFADPAVHKPLEVDLALIPYEDELLQDLARSILKTAKHHEAHTLDLLHTVPGIGTILSLVLLYELHALARFPPVQEFVSYGRLVKCAKESAGKRLGPSGKNIGTAHLQGAFSEAAALFLRNHPAGQTYRARVENTHDQGKALTIRAHKLARAGYDMRKRHTAFDRATFLQG
jgi:transposase